MIKALSQQSCDAGYHYSDAFGGCVLDDPGVVVDVPTCQTGQHYSDAWGGCVSDSTGTPARTFDPKFLLYGLGALLLLGAFMGGRASGGSRRSSGKLLSRTTTRSIFG